MMLPANLHAPATSGRVSRRGRSNLRPLSLCAISRPHDSAQDHNRCADSHAVIEVDHVLVGHAKATRRYRLADGLGLVRSVNAVKRRSEINGTRAQRVFDTTHHMPRQVGAPAQHLGGRRPIRPFLLHGYAMGAGPGEAKPAYPDAIA